MRAYEPKLGKGGHVDLSTDSLHSTTSGANHDILTLPVLLSVHNRTIYVRHKVNGLCLKMHVLPPRDHYSTRRPHRDLNYYMPLRIQ